jgi:hypothetical protein
MPLSQDFYYIMIALLVEESAVHVPLHSLLMYYLLYFTCTTTQAHVLSTVLCTQGYSSYSTILLKGVKFPLFLVVYEEFEDICACNWMVVELTSNDAFSIYYIITCITCVPHYSLMLVVQSTVDSTYTTRKRGNLTPFSKIVE